MEVFDALYSFDNIEVDFSPGPQCPHPATAASVQPFKPGSAGRLHRRSRQPLRLGMESAESATHVTGVILAGSKSRRMGRDKAFLPIGEGLLIERVIEVIRQVTEDVMLIANPPEPYQRFGLPMFSDVVPEAGSLGGIYTGLVYAKTASSLCLACDMAFMNHEFSTLLCETAAEADVVIPKNVEDFQPLCAVYSQVCREPIRQRIERGRLKITSFFDQVRVRIIEGDLLARYDPHDVMFFNANTPEEYAKVQHHLSSSTSHTLPRSSPLHTLKGRFTPDPCQRMRAAVHL